MRKLAIIPARYESSRFAGKPLIDLLGKTMIQHVYDRVSQSGLFDAVIVATDDERILDHVSAFGGKAMMTSADHQSGTERCGEVIVIKDNFDVVVNIQGDEPLVEPNQLEELLGAFEDPNVEIATLGTPKITSDEKEDNNRIKIVIDQESNALYFSRSKIPFELNDVNYPYLRHIGLYGFRVPVLKRIIQLAPTQLERVESLEQLRWLYYGFKIKVVETAIETPNIDVPEDVEQVLAVMRQQHI